MKEKNRVLKERMYIYIYMENYFRFGMKWLVFPL